MWINLMRSYVGFCTIFSLTSLICQRITLKILEKKKQEKMGEYCRSVSVTKLGLLLLLYIVVIEFTYVL